MAQAIAGPLSPLINSLVQYGWTMDKFWRCTNCRSEFTNRELEKADACPSCGCKGMPMNIAHDTTININWHELRILVIWAMNHAHAIKESVPDDPIETIKAIVKPLSAFRPSGAPPLTIAEEMQEVANVLEQPVIVHQDGRTKTIRPKPKQ